MNPESIRNQLLARRAELEALSEKSGDSRAPVELDQQSVGRLSRMDAMQQQAMAEATEAQRTRELTEIRAALMRIDQDDYGYCEDCGAEIPEKRLLLYPAIRYCVSCQESRE